MTDTHVEELLVAHARGELEGGERAQTERHLSGCSACRDTLAAAARLMTELERTAPAPPPIHWGAYRAELREKLERRGGRPTPAQAWLWRPAPALIAAGLLAAVIYLDLPGAGRRLGNGDSLAMDDTILASRLDMIAKLEVVQRLDLLEDFDVISNLDRLQEGG